MQVIESSHLTILIHELQSLLKDFYGDRFLHLVLFGSQARGEATEDSDIDILLVLKGDICPGDEILRMSHLRTDLNLKYNELISIIPVSEEDFQERRSPLLENARRDGILL